VAFEPADQSHVAQGGADPFRPVLALGELQGAREDLGLSREGEIVFILESEPAESAR
jgi:hypothetical protein